ncbi:VMAP-C domain-containing protein [Streptomyces sp. NPDC001002]
METAAGLSEFGRAPGRDLLFRLTEALCGLGCLDDQAGRTYFATLLSEQLNLRVDLRGVKQREDVIAMARAALSVMAGERILIDVVRVFEGASVADRFEQLLTPPAASSGVASPLFGPLSEEDVGSALALLDDAETRLSEIGLRDGLAGELHLDLPLHLSVIQLFSFVLELNVQPDGLPPAVLLMEHAALQSRNPGRRLAFSAWSHRWADRAGLLAELEQRRSERMVVTTDASIPRCLVVAVDPARDGSGDIVVRPWLNTVPGRWHPQPAEPETTGLDGLGPAVERALRQVIRLSPRRQEQVPLGIPQSPPYVEFVLPYDLLNHDVAGLRLRSGDGKPLPLALKYGVHLRSLERMRTDDALVRTQWLERWNTLQSQGIGVHGWQARDADRLDEWLASLAAEPSRTAVVIDAPDGGAATDALKAAIAEGVGLAVWDRRGEFLEERREVVTAVFAAVPACAQIPIAIHRLRRTAELDVAGLLLLGRHIAFFWDDPYRLVDIQVVVDDLAVSGKSAESTDSEESA